jgi:hypothetical protein
VSGEARGKDLKWTPSAAARDAAMAHSAFRNTLNMITTLDDEHIEELGDASKLLAQRLNRDLEELRTLLTKMVAIQAEKRKEADKAQ